MKPETLQLLVAFTRECETAIENICDDAKLKNIGLEPLKATGSGLRRMLNAEAAEQKAIAQLIVEDSMPHNEEPT